MPPDDPAATRWARVSAAFDAAADLPAEARAEALDRWCLDADGQPDADLRAEVEALLAADAQATATAAPFRLTDSASVAALVESEAVAGERVGPWRVVRPIGRGGMGRVDLVERADGGYQQQAALKRLSLVAPGRVRRFLRERQILASLDHPGIARLLDGGVDESGAPYLVMEYVEGVPITDYARTHNLGLRERLALFVQVCDAVAFAHRHLVVHRDLKPSNVLVGDPKATPTSPAPRAGRATDAPGQVALLDFGIARLLDPDDDDDEMLTVEATVPLTPGYAAPEQVAGEAVTTATDVYALGVLLYELLTGRRPYLADTREAWAEAVLHRTPPPPSQTVVPGQRSPLQRRLRGDLDAIALTALRREPEARYASAHDLGADLRRYLAGEPVQARRPSPWYRARRFVGRHRAWTAAAALVVVSVGIGTAATLWQARQARVHASESEAAVAFLTDLLGAADPLAAGRRDTLSVGSLLDEGAARLGSLDGQPRVQARLLAVLGQTYRAVERWDDGEPLLRDALALYEQTGAPPGVRARVLADLATTRSAQGDPDEAEALADEALRLAHTDPDPETLIAAELALAFVRLRQAMSQGADSLLLAARARSVAFYGEGNRTQAAIERHLGEMYLNRGDGTAAEPHLRRSIDLTAEILGETHPGLIAPLETLALAHLFTGDAAAAEAVAARALAIARTQAGRNRLGSVLTKHAQALRRLGRLDEAEADLREAVPLMSRREADRALPLATLATVLRERGRLGEAIEAQTEALDVLADGVTRGRPATPSAAIKLADLLREAGRFAQAERALDRAQSLTQSLDPDYARMTSMLDGQMATARVALYQAWGRPAEAARWQDRVPAARAPGHGS